MFPILSFWLVLLSDIRSFILSLVIALRYHILCCSYVLLYCNAKKHWSIYLTALSMKSNGQLKDMYSDWPASRQFSQSVPSNWNVSCTFRQPRKTSLVCTGWVHDLYSTIVLDKSLLGCQTVIRFASYYKKKYFDETSISCSTGVLALTF